MFECVGLNQNEAATAGVGRLEEYRTGIADDEGLGDEGLSYLKRSLNPWSCFALTAEDLRLVMRGLGRRAAGVQ